MLPFLDPCPGLVYGAAFALALNNLFSPIFRVEEAGWKGSVVANVDVFFSHFLHTIFVLCCCLFDSDWQGKRPVHFF